MSVQPEIALWHSRLLTQQWCKSVSIMMAFSLISVFTTYISPSAPIIYADPMNLSVPVNTYATLSCQVRTEAGESLRNITWQGPQSPLPVTTMTEQDGIITSNLTVNLTADYEGEYNCTAQYTDCTETVTSLSATLTVLPPPVILMTSEQAVLRMPGDSVTFSCVSTNIGTISIEWRDPEGSPLSGAQLVVEGNVTSSLTLTAVEARFGGLYQCTAINEAGRNSAYILLYITPVVTPDRTLVSVNDLVELTCAVQEPPLGDFQWQLNTQSLQAANNRTLTFMATYSSGGTYRCTVDTNSFGVLTSTTSLVVGMHNDITHVTVFSTPMLQCLLSEV